MTCVRGAAAGAARAPSHAPTIILRGCATAACLCAQRVMECDDVAERSACDARERSVFLFLFLSHSKHESRWPRARALTGRTAGHRGRPAARCHSVRVGTAGARTVSITTGAFHLDRPRRR